jgi:PAS domain S-box-containing protein
MNKAYLKIVLPTIFSILLFILTIFLLIIPRYKENIMNGKREMIRELTNSALSILTKYENDEKEGILTREGAQEIARSRIQYLRYGEENKDYFWITDLTPVMIMHPFRNDLNGKDLNDFTDPHGKKLFVEFVNTVKANGQGYVDYMWQWKDDSLNIVPKLSYVKIFEPWNWVIGTGIYIEDVKKEISSLTKRMIWLSAIISLLIAVLLFYIIKESLGIEQKRIKAVNDLHESNEKYRTLVEATTEGLIMITGGKISFSNSVMSKMTGYESAELSNLEISDLIGKNNQNNIPETFSGESVSEGKFELNLKKKNGDFIEVLITSTATVFYGKPVNIIIVKDLSTDGNIRKSDLGFQKLISTTDAGVFRAGLDSGGRFIVADEKTLNILGFSDFKELSEIPVRSLFADPDDRKYIRKAIEENGTLKNKVIRIRKKNGEHSIISLSLVLISNKESDGIICDGIIEDITLRESERIHTSELITQLKLNEFMFGQPVKDRVTNIGKTDAESTLSEVINYLKTNKTDCVLLTKNEKDCIGIITNTDIQRRLLTLNLKHDNPAYLIMSSPVKYISENTSILDALLISDAKKMNHLIVRNESDEITGVFRTHDIYNEMTRSLSFLPESIRQAKTDAGLKECHNNLLRIIKPLILNDIAANYITKITSTFSDELTRRLIDLAIRDLGAPPAAFAFICLGSEGRMEETLYTDQDNAIIYDDVPKEDNARVNAYFLKLGELVCNSLNYIGYSFCKGNIMAKNQKWCQPLSVWKGYFREWIFAPEPQNLLDATIFFDFRTVYGDEKISVNLNESVSANISENPLFLYHLAYNTCSLKHPHISSGSILSDKNADLIDLKSALVPLIMFARTYSLQNGIRKTNTIERLKALKEQQVITGDTIDEILFTYNFLMKLRFRNQAEMLTNHMPMTNSLNTKNLIDPELILLRKVLSYIAEYQNKIKTDFRVTG